MIKTIRIENLRSIKDSGVIELKPINILLGANSSGKSTFLRSFPLITQSVNKSLRGPISWFDSTLVDFGDFDTAKSKYAPKDDCIRFSYDIEYEDDWDLPWDEVCLKRGDLVKATFALSADTEGTYIKELSFLSSVFNLSLVVGSRHANVQFTIDEKVVPLTFNVRFGHYSRFGLFPTLVAHSAREDKEVDFEQIIHDAFEEQLTKLCDVRFKNKDKLRNLLSYSAVDKEGFLAHLLQNVKVESLRKRVSLWTVKDEEFLNAYNLFLLSKVDSLSFFFNSEISEYYSSCGYSAPLRAEANRYYRNQELQINDVDAYGRNLQEFIASLSKTAKKDYESFMNETLKIIPRVTTSMGLQSIVLQSGNDSFNLADVGYGYSQVLPILTKIWHFTYETKQERKHYRIFGYDQDNWTLLMEQPELHLHPALQAKIADCLINCIVINNAEESGGSHRLIVETHSQTIINRIGRRIREGKVSAEDVNVLLFKKDIDNKNTIIEQVSYNDNGQLVNWPWGFFDPED